MDKDLIRTIANEHGLSTSIVTAICLVESSGNNWATRYESHWKWFLNPIKYAKLRGHTTKTERIHQATSWGLMQVMGTVARELGYTADLPSLCVPRNGLDMGCKKLQQLLKKHKTLTKALSAYNTGKPDSKKGKIYADKVIKKC